MLRMLFVRTSKPGRVLRVSVFPMKTKRFFYFLLGCVRLAWRAPQAYWHIFGHAFGCNSGQWENWLTRGGKLMCGRRCHHCGKLTQIKPMTDAPRRRALH